MANGIGPIGMLQGKVNAQYQLLVSTVASAADALSEALDGDTAYTDAVLIPAPPPGFRVVVTSFIASALVQGAFSVLLKVGPDRALGPLWLPASGPLGQATGRVFVSGPIVRPLPAGQGLTVTTSGDAPQSVFVGYHLEPVG
jgi:hypothetical protein